MRWRSRTAGTLGILGIAALAVAAWALVRRPRDPPPGHTAAPHRALPPRTPGDPPGGPAAARARSPAGAPDTDMVTVTGQVIEIPLRRPVAGVEVVLRGAAGETTTTTRADGGYAIQLVPGRYRAFVRDRAVLSIARSDPPRLPGPLAADVVGVPDEGLMTVLVARSDLDGIELPVVRSGVITGQVVDGAGEIVDGAIVQASGGTRRPALATDIAESGADGRFELRLPPGSVFLTASHPRFAGVARDDRTPYLVRPGDRLTVTLVMSRGCVVSGRIVTHDGEPAGDGALERKWGVGELAFRPAGQLAPDGRFRWSSTEDDDVTLRAWPWASPPSSPRTFACRDGARFDHVTFRLGDRRPDLQGALVDKAGRPVELAFLDVRPLDPENVAQQERSDAAGNWAIYALPPGRYRILAQAEGRGVVATTVVAPRDSVRLELGGTGRLDGTTPHLARGSLEIELVSCADDTGALTLPPARRLVPVIGGRFTVDDVPACKLAFRVSYRGRAQPYEVTVPAGGAAQVEIALGEPRRKMVHGTVRDLADSPVPNAVVSALPADAGDAANHTTVSTAADGSGRFTIQTTSGATLSAVAAGKVGEAQVGGANIDTEQVDIVIDGATGSGGHAD